MLRLPRSIRSYGPEPPSPERPATRDRPRAIPQAGRLSTSWVRGPPARSSRRRPERCPPRGRPVPAIYRNEAGPPTARHPQASAGHPRLVGEPRSLFLTGGQQSTSARTEWRDTTPVVNGARGRGASHRPPRSRSDGALCHTWTTQTSKTWDASWVRSATCCSFTPSSTTCTPGTRTSWRCAPPTRSRGLSTGNTCSRCGSTTRRRIVHWNEAESGRVADRPQFRRMLDEASGPDAPFQEILL